MTQDHRTTAGPDASPLARRLREAGFIVNARCERPTLERLGELHLHREDACATAYCVACVKPLCALSEIIPNDPECEGDSEVEVNDLCLVCEYCGVIYSDQMLQSESGVLSYLIVEGANLLEELRLFDGVPAEDFAHVAIARVLDEREARLKRGLEAIAEQRGKLAKGEYPKPSAAKKRGVLKLVADDSATEPDPGPNAA
ncbi:MAG: hypothetical protein QY323_04515 [Patescibacteria group bacterium]|nr:MAG: hypothetical protein QY323_04515 [Patescibacteria group bacterium]